VYVGRVGTYSRVANRDFLFFYPALDQMIGSGRRRFARVTRCEDVISFSVWCGYLVNVECRKRNDDEDFDQKSTSQPILS
jgi:hypothetical protein